MIPFERGKTTRKRRVARFARLGMLQRLEEAPRFQLRIRHQSVRVDDGTRRDAFSEERLDRFVTRPMPRPFGDTLA